MPDVPVLAVLAVYAVMSLIAFGTYAFDKRRAKTGGRRVPERTLQTLALLGGWPGALLARSKLRHKTRKRAFTATLYAIALLHLAFWTWRILPGSDGEPKGVAEINRPRLTTPFGR